MFYSIFLVGILLIILLYFRFAVRYNIVDKPNHRSSHKQVTIRGGGIIFPIALLLQFLVKGFDYPFFTVGLLLISLVSFYDDLRTLSNKVRLTVHLIAVSLLFIQAGLLDHSVWTIGLIYIIVIGSINAYNFMDGINGITGAYSVVTLLSLYFINGRENFVESEWLLVSILALLVFNFFNFRKKAKCFAGDVGSVSIAFIIIFFLLLLILKTGELKYVGFLLLYGLDSVTTIIFRIIRGENIFKAHRSHFYQYLANVKGWPHLGVSTLYMLLQLISNLLIVFSEINWVLFLVLSLLLGLLFIVVRFNVEGKNSLIGIRK